MKDIQKKTAMGIIILATFMIPINVVGMANPSAVYCEDMDYEIIVEETEGGQIGVCKFSETEKCPTWLFLEGKCGEEYSYCAKQGYKIKTTDDPEKCLLGGECAVCVLENGTEIEVTKLMELEEGFPGPEPSEGLEIILSAIVLIVIIVVLIAYNHFKKKGNLKLEKLSGYAYGLPKNK